LLDPSFPSLASFSVFAAMAFQNYAREERQRVAIRGAFSRYVSPTLVEQLVREPGKLVLGGETRELSVLFCDVRGFTRIAELYRDDPKGLTQFMNRLLTPLTDAILEHGGTVDKYMGDAILAFWNAPLDDMDHAKHACSTALDMLERLKVLNEQRRAEDALSGTPHIPIVLGIGINTGLCTVGNMGSDARFDYSALGDSVNIASRLQDLTKIYGLQILIGSSTAHRIQPDYQVLAIDTVRVKGKEHLEDIHVLLPPAGHDGLTAGSEFKAALTSLRACCDRLDWVAANTRLATCQALLPNGPYTDLLAIYAQRITAGLAHGASPTK
jgi:adenylate cyclase